MAGTYGTETVLGSLIVIGWHDRLANPVYRDDGFSLVLVVWHDLHLSCLDDVNSGAFRGSNLIPRAC